MLGIKIGRWFERDVLAPRNLAFFEDTPHSELRTSLEIHGYKGRQVPEAEFYIPLKFRK